MEEFTFEDLPNIMGKLYRKMDKIERLLKAKKRSDKDKNEELLTIEGASKLLSLSVATIYTKVCKNEIPVNKQGKRLYFYREELLDWIKSGRIKTIAEIQNEVEAKFNSKLSSK
ncbi:MULTISPECIES: helix-turn-helix domain-containing protein [unclassified Flavobacterium]|uniref:helix-turn-helix domain-containing protein n=1 Tax=unclassified Flavobacterium TaxID=196869 RepID=UPI00057E84F9|nr:MULTISPECIES: helix-turn-helix domain-containing protein [unclassified Flavobacterium]KIA95585.1 DNA-binding protein [Flavobacterium sp. KMS]OUL62617.1 DNA-binding protein [Flavobacterium sp. AJR]